MRDTLTSGGLRKDTSNLIECRIDSCNATDTFLVANYGNQSKYRIIGKTITGDFEVQSTRGETKMTLRPDYIVWRNKTLCEIFNTDNEPNILAPELKRSAPAPTEPKKASNLLIDILSTDENEINILNFI